MYRCAVDDDCGAMNEVVEGPRLDSKDLLALIPFVSYSSTHLN